MNPRSIPSSVFYQRQPFVPSPEAVDAPLAALRHAEHRLATIRRAYHGTRSGYRRAHAAFRAIRADVRHRHIAACVEFSPLLYNSFYLTRGSLNLGAGHLYLHAVRRIQTALCG